MCNYCKKKGHVKDECYNLHDRPEEADHGYGGQQKGQVNLSQSKELPQSKEEFGSQKSSSTLRLDTQDIKRLKAFLETLRTSSTNLGGCSFVQLDMSLASHGYSASNSNQPTSWIIIIDFDATDHMTFSSISFSTCTPCSSSWKIITADGSPITVAGVSAILLSPFLTLKNDLHAPKLSTNLISVHHLLHDLNCSLTFLPNGCGFIRPNFNKDDWAC